MIIESAVDRLWHAVLATGDRVGPRGLGSIVLYPGRGRLTRAPVDDGKEYLLDARATSVVSDNDERVPVLAFSDYGPRCGPW